MAATVAMHEAGSTGNTDRQQSDSRVSAEGKGTACILKKKKNGQEWQVPRLANGEEEKERGQLEKWANWEPSPLSSAPPGFWPAASSSINSTQGNGEGGKEGMGRGDETRRVTSTAKGDGEVRKYRKKMWRRRFG